MDLSVRTLTLYVVPCHIENRYTSLTQLARRMDVRSVAPASGDVAGKLRNNAERLMSLEGTRTIGCQEF